MDGGGGGGGGDTASYDDVGGDTASYDNIGGDNPAAVEGDYGGEGTQPPQVMSVAVFLTIRRRRRPRVTRPRRQRAVVPPGAAGSDHGARRSKKFQQWRESYLRAKIRERKEETLW
ncbi:unnamed protein product [Urochloa humidicola]